MENNNGDMMACEEDVVVEILCRLPGKDLIRCKCVCRAWHRLICEICIPRVSLNPPFSFLSVAVLGPYVGWWKPRTRRYKHLNFVEEESGGPRGFISSARGSLPFRQTTMDRLLNSCNGLLLFRTPIGRQYYVGNPTTTQFAMLPTEYKHKGRRCSAVLAFDPCKSPHYKVVRFTSSGERHVLLGIYSSESGKWVGQTLPLDNLVPFPNWYRSAVFFDGTIYRLSTTGQLLCFDLKVVVNGRRIDTPDAERAKRCTNRNSGVLGVSMGHLCYAKLYTIELNVWLLNDRCEGDQWILKYRVIHDFEKEVPSCVKVPFFGLFYLHPFGFHPNSDVVFIGTHRMILSYDFKAKTLKEVVRTKEGTSFAYPVYTHVQCLVPLAVLD